MAAVVPHSWCRCIRQSAYMLVDCFLSWGREWGTMAAAVGHLDHDASTVEVLFVT
jgi:hypothetical protein